MSKNIVQPVAWQYRIINRFGETDWTNCSLLEANNFQEQGDDPFFGRYEVRPLYAMPQPALQPLTGEQIEQLFNLIPEKYREFFRYVTDKDFRVVFTRAIEAAHGITEQKEA